MMTTDDAWICYAIQWLCGDRWETPYYGACAAASFNTLPDANGNSLFVQMITDRETWKALPLSVHTTADDAEAARTILIDAARVKPHFNMHGTTVEIRKRGRSTRLRNMATGAEYDSGQHAARMLGVTVSMVSKHLTGHSATVAGVTLERLT